MIPEYNMPKAAKQWLTSACFLFFKILRIHPADGFLIDLIPLQMLLHLPSGKGAVMGHYRFENCAVVIHQF